ncbi:MAG: 3-hydroxybutyryl-CoA dehydrogenase [Holophagaceae bacterium]|nr:3-hydroxybutyryl-CoA dehydrogenase [Holophagaceae bacterium]
MERLAIIGPGTLGLSLARWGAECGLQVALAGRNRDHVDSRLGEADLRWEIAVRKGRITAGQWQEARGRLRGCGTWEAAVEGARWVLEALPESLDEKAQAWSRLDSFLPGVVSRLTGTSSISSASIQAASGMGSPLLAFHCFVPLERMGIVELAGGERVPRIALEGALALAARLGKRVAMVQDQTGFAAARMALAQGLEAMRLLESGMASAEDLDALLTQGYGHPVGPLELSDRIGLDLRLTIAKQIFASTGDPRFDPPGILRQLVDQGRLGLKTGAGFFEWDEKGKRR